MSPSGDRDRLGLDFEGRFTWYTLEFNSSTGDAILWCYKGITWQGEGLHQILCISGVGSSQSVHISL